MYMSDIPDAGSLPLLLMIMKLVCVYMSDTAQKRLAGNADHSLFNEPGSLEFVIS